HLGRIEYFQPSVARELKSRSASALRRLPQDVLAAALSSMDVERAGLLRRLRRRPAVGVAA
ncbi:glycosyltransferase family 2 protein, partial [Streptomyces sp. SID11233]|nr:glycosyltransferase family 2 protein [Streptomyces sp. SID11233]